MEKKINWKKGILGDGAQEVEEEEEEEEAEAEKVSLVLACLLLVTKFLVFSFQQQIEKS